MGRTIRDFCTAWLLERRSFVSEAVIGRSSCSRSAKAGTRIAAWLECSQTQVHLEPKMPLPDFLAVDPDGELRLTGHRIRLIDVAQRYQEGFSVEGIVEHYPSLNLSLVHKVVAYFLEHEAEVGSLISANQDEMDRLRAEAGPATPSLVELRSRFGKKFPLSDNQTKAV